MTALRNLLLACLLCVAAPAWAATDTDPDLARLANALSALDGDQALVGRAGLERFKARQALARLQSARRRDRDHALLLADARVAAAIDAAQAELLVQQAQDLDRQRDQILLEASRRDAELAWREADRLRLQNLAREEQAQRESAVIEAAAEQAQADTQLAEARAAQAEVVSEARAREVELARKAAELSAAIAADSLQGDANPPPSRKQAGRTIYTLPGSAFASGSAIPTASAQASLRAMAGQIERSRTVQIQGHTDSQGGDAANLLLSQKRADAVRQVLLDAGLSAGRVRASGKGETDPLVDNGTADGRARNRRVEIMVE